MIATDNEFTVSTDRGRLNIAMIHEFLSTQAYWSKGIPQETVRKALDHSLVFGVYCGEKQTGFARIVTDFSTIAYLADVFILPEYRGRGLSKLLLRSIRNHPDLQGLRRWILRTADAHGLYRQFGWKPIAGPERWMEIHDKDVYCSIPKASK